MGNNENEIDNKEIYDSIGARITRLLSSFRDDGLTNLDIYHKIYGNREITEAAKKNKIADLCGGRKINTNDLICISQTFGISLDWLVFGKEVSPAQDEVEKEDACNKEKIRTTPTVNEQLDAMKSEREGLEAMKNALIESLLNNDHPVLQACASFLNLLRYSNIFLEGDYDIDNIETPQCLTIRIIPKLFCTRGKYDNENLRFDCSFKNNRDSLLLVWDFRATLIQRFIALSLNWQERSCFNEKALLDSAFQFMIKTHAREHHSYKEFDCFGQNPAHGLLHYSIDDIFSKYVMIMQTYPYFSTTYDYESGEADPIRFTNYCDGEKVPSAIKQFGRYDNIC